MYKKEYMDLAIKEAIKAFKEDEVPIGCVIVKDDVILAKAHNKKEKKKDPTAHSEIECIKKACKKLNNWHLDDCDIYVTLEPCIMCAGAIVNARIKYVYFGSVDFKGGAFGSNVDVTKVKKINHYPSYQYINDERCEIILKEFFKGKRK